MDRVVLLRGRNAELKRIRLVIAIAGSLMAFLAWSTPALGAERRCGDLTAVALSDPISGGTVSIEGRKFLVAGLGRNVHLPAVTELRVGVVVCAEGDFRVLSDGSVDLTNGSVGLLRAARARDSVSVCGKLHGLDVPTATNNEGAASLADEIWFLSGTPGPNNLSPQVTVGSNVCLSGQVATSQTTRNLLVSWNLVPSAAQSASPSATSAPLTSAAASAAAAASVRVSALPSTTDPQLGALWPMVLGAIAAIALIALLVTRASARRIER